jgi:NAD(P)-dependent dehydrogenase (short-subunit alcohol dehydrogenase family)
MKNKHIPVVLITGCSSGFGRAMVTAFLKEGWNVFATMRRVPERRALFSEDLVQYGGRLTVLELDVTSPSERQEVVDAVRRGAGRLDCLINNAGYMLLGAFEATSEEQLRQELEVNFFGAVLLLRLALPLLRASRGVVINISSVFGFMTWPLTSLYCASKFAVEGWSQSLAQELRPHGVRVALVEPSGYATHLADNIEWGNESVDDSPYDREIEAYRKLRVMLRDQSAHSLNDVSDTAIRVVRNATGTKLRYPIGGGARMTYFLTRWFPELLGVRLMARLFRYLCRRAMKRVS